MGVCASIPKRKLTAEISVRWEWWLSTLMLIRLKCEQQLTCILEAV